MKAFFSRRAVAAARLWACGMLYVTVCTVGIWTQNAQAAQFVDAAPLPAPRSRLAAVLLPSGKVFAVGGSNGTSFGNTETYDPAADTWTPAAALAFARSDFTATLLANGNVLAAAGYGSGALKSAEVYNPATNTWTRTGDLAAARSGQTATLLASGKVLVVGGYNLGSLASAELYDPATNAWSSAGTLHDARHLHAAALLPSGKVLVAGGFGVGSVPLSSAELYDPATNTWTTTGSMSAARAVVQAVALPSGKILIEGGDSPSGVLASAELYDPASGTWAPAATMSHTRSYYTATLLSSGHVLVAGGYDGAAVLDAEIYDPTANVWHVAGTMSTAREFHAAVALPSGKVLIAGGTNSAALDSVELYDPTTTTSITSITPDPSQAGENYTVTFEVGAAFGTPTGSVTVSDGRGASCGPVVLSAGAGSCALASASPGGYSITAAYTADDDAFAASSGFVSHFVGSVLSVVEIVSDTPDPSELFEPYDVVAHVTVADFGNPAPTGIVTISNGTFDCTANLDDTGNALCTLFGDTVGTLSLTANYSGDEIYESASSTTPEEHTVARASTSLTLLDAAGFTVATQPATFIVQLDTALGGDISGVVTISDGEDSCAVELSGTFASCDVVFMHAGWFEVTASYGGDANHAPSVSEPVPHFVNQATTHASIRSHTPDPSAPAQPVTVTVDVFVDAPGAGTPPGPIQVFGDFGQQLCTIAQSGGSCELMLTFRGQQELEAQYLANTDFTDSFDFVQHRVNEAPTPFGDTYTVYEDQTFAVGAAQGVLANDQDEDGDTLVVVNTGPQTASGIGGTVTLSADGSFAYMPPANANGEAGFDYTVSDGLETAMEHVVLVVQPVNDPPVFTLSVYDPFPPGTNGDQVIANVAKIVSMGQPDENNQSVLAWDLRIIDDPQGVLTAVPSITSDGALDFSASGHGGIAMIGVALQDDGGTENGGQDTSAEQTYFITVGSSTDLSIAIDDGTAFVDGGGQAAYLIVVSNVGFDAPFAARVESHHSLNLRDASWTCTPDPGAECTASGSGDVLDNVSLPPGATLVYALTGTVDAMPELPLQLEAAVDVFGGTPDLNPLNDSASDINVIGIFADGFDQPDVTAEGDANVTTARATKAMRKQ